MGVDAVVVAAGASRRMGGIDKLTAIVAGRPLLAWSLGGDGRVARPSTGSSLVVAPERVAEVAAARLAAGRRRPSSRAGTRARRRSRPACGTSTASIPTASDRPVPRPRRRPAAGHRRRWSRPSWRRSAGTGRRSPSCPWPRRSSGSTAGASLETVDRAGLAAAQTPQGARRRLLLEAWDRFPPDGPPSFTDEAALLEACTITVHAIPGEPTNLKVTLPDDLRRVEQLLARRRAAGRVRPRQPPVRARARRSASAASRSTARPRSPATPTATSCCTRSPTRCSARPARATSGGCFPADERTPRGIASDAAAARRRRAARRRGPRARRRWTSRSSARARASGRRLDAMRAAIADALGLDAARRQRQGLDRQPGRRRGGGPDDLGAGRRARCGAAR